MSQIGNNLCIGKVLKHYNECLSTNDLLKDLVSNSTPIEGTVVFTDNQTKGRGQIGNVWNSEKDMNCIFSVLLYPKKLMIVNQFYISKIACIAIVAALRELGLSHISIKWPNDIYIGKKKVAGILVENQLSGSQIKNSIIGIGLNVNQQNFEGLQNATSLKNELNRTFEVQEVMELVLKQLDALYLRLRNQNYTAVDQLYFDSLMFYKELTTFVSEGVEFVAEVHTVQPNGTLELLVNNEIKTFQFKEVEWIM